MFYNSGPLHRVVGWKLGMPLENHYIFDRGRNVA